MWRNIRPMSFEEEKCPEVCKLSHYCFWQGYVHSKFNRIQDVPPLIHNSKWSQPNSSAFKAVRNNLMRLWHFAGCDTQMRDQKQQQPVSSYLEEEEAPETFTEMTQCLVFIHHTSRGQAHPPHTRNNKSLQERHHEWHHDQKRHCASHLHNE